MRFGADLRGPSGRFGVVLGGIIGALFPRIVDLENISEHCAETHITKVQIMGIHDAKTWKSREHTQMGFDFLNHSENQTPFI